MRLPAVWGIEGYPFLANRIQALPGAPPMRRFVVYNLFMSVLPPPFNKSPRERQLESCCRTLFQALEVSVIHAQHGRPLPQQVVQAMMEEIEKTQNLLGIQEHLRRNLKTAKL